MGILLIDDSKVMRTILKTQLQPLGNENFFEAKDGREGLQKLQEEFEYIDTVFVDANMPVMDGEAFIRAVEDIGVQDCVNCILISSHLKQIEAVQKQHPFIFVAAKPVVSGDLEALMQSLPDKKLSVSPQPPGQNSEIDVKLTSDICLNFYFYRYKQEIENGAAYNKNCEHVDYHLFKPFLHSLHEAFEQADSGFAGDRITKLWQQVEQYEQCYNSLSLKDNTAFRQLFEKMLLHRQRCYVAWKQTGENSVAVEEHERRMFNSFAEIYGRKRKGYKKIFKRMIENRLDALCKALFAEANKSSAITKRYGSKGFELPLTAKSYIKQMLQTQSADTSKSTYKRDLEILQLLKKQKRREVIIIHEDFERLEALKKEISLYDSQLVVRGLRSVGQLLLHKSTLKPHLIVADFENKQMQQMCTDIKEMFADATFLLLFHPRSKKPFYQACQNGLVYPQTKNFLCAPKYLDAACLHEKLQTMHI